MQRSLCNYLRKSWEIISGVTRSPTSNKTVTVCSSHVVLFCNYCAWVGEEERAWCPLHMPNIQLGCDVDKVMMIDDFCDFYTKRISLEHPRTLIYVYLRIIAGADHVV